MPLPATARPTLPRRSLVARGLAAVVGLLLGWASAPGAEPALRPPFQLAWDQTAIDLEEALLGGSGRIVERKRLPGGGESWTVEGLPQPALQRAIFHLPKHQLAAVELQYGKPEWTSEDFEALMQSVKTGLEQRYGPGVLIARKQDSARGVLQTLLGYRWEATAGAIELVYFAAQNPDNLFRAVSLHYFGPRVTSPPPTPAPAHSISTSSPAPGVKSRAQILPEPPLPPLPRE